VLLPLIGDELIHDLSGTLAQASGLPLGNSKQRYADNGMQPANGPAGEVRPIAPRLRPSLRIRPAMMPPSFNAAPKRFVRRRPAWTFDEARQVHSAELRATPPATSTKSGRAAVVDQSRK
jgi:hypothetical protein